LYKENSHSKSRSFNTANIKTPKPAIGHIGVGEESKVKSSAQCTLIHSVLEFRQNVNSL